MNALSLFSGIGGIDLACEWAGIKTVAMCEREPFCQRVLHKHWPDVPIYDDVCTLTKERLEADGIGTIDLIHGGYPCQPFSLAGQREGENDDRHLWPEVFRLIQELNPRWFVGENVVGHVTLGLDAVLSDLESIGYSWESFVIPASAVNARHRRERVFIVAYSESERRDAWWSESKGQQRELRTTWGGTSSRSKNVANANGKPNLETSKATGAIRSGRKSWDDARWSGGGYEPGIDWWAAEPGMGRVANGVPNRVDRLKSLGNAVVPQQIYPILAAIKQIDDLINAA
jgi:DNA (cytosine-5)-methyltransferase 1